MLLLILMLDYLLSFVMLLPLKDDRGRYRSFPIMTVGLVALNTIVFALVNVLLWLRVGDVEMWFTLIRPFMLVPADVLAGGGAGALSMITSAFLHADLWHLAGNMLFLVFFGRKVEDVMGPARFGLFYLVCALGSGVGSVAAEAALPVTQGKIPGLGASGAIMGVVAAYMFLYHEQRIRTLVVLAILPIPVALPMPAWMFMLYTVSRDLMRGWLEQQAQAQGSWYSLVGSFAHLGGIITGLACIYFFLPRELLHYRHRPEEALEVRRR
jgi:membrane associated rhomboid family serine protease